MIPIAFKWQTFCGYMENGKTFQRKLYTRIYVLIEHDIRYNSTRTVQ